MSRWFNATAIEWVLYEAPGDMPPSLLAPYMAVASFTDYEGRGGYPSADTVAKLTRKSERQAKRDLQQLRNLGLLAPGDPKRTAHLSADLRPNVYDLPPRAREYIGRHRKRGDAYDTPHGVTPTTPRGPYGVTSSSKRGDADVSYGVSPTSPEELFKSSRKGVPPARDAGSADGPPEGQNRPRPVLRCPTCRMPFTADDIGTPQDRAAAERGELVHDWCPRGSNK